MNLNFDDEFLDGHGVFEVAFTVEKLLQSCYQIIDDLTVRFALAGEDGGTIVAFAHERNASFGERIDEDGVACIQGG